MQIIEEHRTPDGLFRFIVERSEDGDPSLGFDGFPSHTHGDILASLSGFSIEAAVRNYIDALLAGRSFIGIARVAGKFATCGLLTSRSLTNTNRMTRL